MVVNNNMEYIVITNTYGRSKDLVERSLNASLSQRIPPIKVILVDQNKEPIKLSKNIIENDMLEVQNILTTSVSVARNRAKKPTSEWIVFCDDDGYMKDDYSETLKQLLTNHPMVKIFAGSIVRDDNYEFYSPRHAIGGDLNNFKFSKLLMGSNFAVKSKTFSELSGFDESFGTGSKWGSGEESDFAWKAHFNKVPMYYAKDLVVYHVKPYAGTIKESIEKAFKYGVGKGALAYKWLIKNKKPIVLLEIAEMTLIPIVKSAIDLIRLQPRNIAPHIASLIGRAYGFLKYLIKS